MIADKIAQLQQEKRLFFDVPPLLNLNRFPKSFFSLQIHELRLSELPKDFEWEGLDVQPMPTVKRLYLETHSPKLLPQLPYLFPNLVELRLSGQQFDRKTDFSFFGQLSKLERLDLQACRWKDTPQLPDSISKLSKLKQLHILYFYSLRRLGKNFSKLTSLEEFSAPSAHLKVDKNSPLLQLPNLRKLSLHDMALMDQAELLLQFPALQHFKRGYKSAKASPFFQDFVPLFNAAKKNHYKVDFLQDCLNYLEQPEKELPNLSNNELIELLDLPLSNFRNKIFTELEKRIQENLPELKAGAEIVLKGKFKSNKRELKEQLKELELIPKNKITATTQLLVLGDLPKIKGDPLTKYPQIKILSEKSLLQLLEPKGEAYLKEAPSQELEKLKELLLNEDPEMNRLGLYMLEQGGCPTELRASLFVLYKINKDKKIKQLALAQIERISPRSFSTVIKKRWPLYNTGMLGITEDKLSKNLQRYLDAAPNELSPKALIQAIYSFCKMGKNYVLSYGDESWAKAFFATDLAQNKLDLAQAQLLELPDYVYNWQNIEQLDIRHNKFAQLIPQNLSKLKNLKELQLCLTPLDTIGEEILALPALKHLHITPIWFRFSLEQTLSEYPILRELIKKGVDVTVFR